ncbi:hypothetical protein B1812_10500 [Methylocystis bryophila]|uniref:Uncharacterized protein n=1 Tax=Methylocystis bryophila TaxID=655015 RepID=A0A1W6MV02_9HYPH|nr:hypothetical protein B1812_10500 [Methylocystis bryophila]
MRCGFAASARVAALIAHWPAEGNKRLTTARAGPREAAGAQRSFGKWSHLWGNIARTYQGVTETV